MAAYTKTKAGYYRASIVTGYMPDGKQKRETVRSKSLADFKEKLKAMENLNDLGYEFDSKNMTVAEWANKWLETYKKPRVEDHCWHTYDTNLRLHILPSIGHLKMAEIKPYNLQDIMNAQKGKSASNTSKIMHCIKQIFSRAYIDGLIVKDISLGLVMPATTTGERRPIAEQERKSILKVAETHRAGLWVLTMLYAGLRPEETISLMWKDINLTDEQESITVQRAASTDHNQPKIKGLKGKKNKKVRKLAEIFQYLGLLLKN